MRNLSFVTVRELRAAMSPAAVISVGLFALVFGYFFTAFLAFVIRGNETAQFGPAGAPLPDPSQALVRPLVQNTTVALLLLLPVLTMPMGRGAWRPREASGAAETVGGRFLGAVALYLVVLGVTLVDIAALSAYSPLAWPPILVAYIGLVLFGAAVLAIGVCVASTVAKPTVAYGATLAVLLVLWAIGMDAASSALPVLAPHMSLTRHFDDFAKGVVDTAHVTYFLSLIGFALWLSIALHARRSGASSGESSGDGTLATSVVAILAVLVAVNYGAAYYRIRWDLTETRAFGLSDASRAVLQRLDAPLRMIVFGTPDDFPRFRDRVDEYAYASRNVSTSFIDANGQPALAQEYGIQTLGTIVLEYKGRMERVTSDAEVDITNGIVKATDTTSRRIYFSVGHGEKDFASSESTGYSQLAEALGRENYLVESLDLEGKRSIPEDANVVIVAGPTQDFLPAEADALRRYLDEGGRLLLELDPRDRPDAPGLPNLVALARDWGVHAGDNMVIDVSGLSADPSVAVASNYPAHPITARFSTITVFPTAREISSVDGGVDGRMAQPLLESGSRSWAEADMRSVLTGGEIALNEDGGDTRGPIAIGSAVTAAANRANGSATDGTQVTRVVVLGDSDFVSNRAIGIGPGNLDLFLNTLAWLSAAEGSVAIPPPPVVQRPLALPAGAQQSMTWLALLVLPGAVLVGGFFGRPANANADVAGWLPLGDALSGSIAMTKSADQTTRLLCASVLFNHGGARKRVLDWIRDPNRAVADELGIDVKLVVQVARFAEARERRYWACYLAISLATAFAASLTTSSDQVTGSTVAVVAIGVIATALVLTVKRIQDRNTFMPMFRLGRFNGEEVAQRFGLELTGDELSAIPSAEQDFFVYAGFMPFVGAGYDLGGWSVAIALDKSKDHLGIPASIVPFETREVYAAIDQDVQQLGLLKIGIKDCYFANGADLRGDTVLLPDKLGRPVQSLAPDDGQRDAWADGDQIRHYRRYQIVDWGGELALSYYLRCVRRGNTLFVETKRFILTPLAEAFRQVDKNIPLDVKEGIGLVAGSVVAGPFLLVAAPFWMLAELSRVWNEAWGTERKARRKLIEKNPLFNYGAVASLRQMLGSGEYGHYFQKMDGDLFNKAVEREVLDSLIAFLDSHGIETSDLKERQTTILNSGVIVHGGDVRADSLAVGTGSQARTQVAKTSRKAKTAGTSA